MILNIWPFKIGCINCAATIIMGAIGGHKDAWSQERKNIFQKAILYQFISSIGLFASSVINSKYIMIPQFLFLNGILLFCIPLYHRAFTDTKQITKFAPYGGMSMILAWTALSFLA